MAAGRRWASLLGVPAIALAFLIAPVLGFPGRLTTGCATWIVIAAGLEVLSVLGFVLVFDLVFGRALSRRQSLGAGLRAVGATTLLPAGTLVGPALCARLSSPAHATAERLTRRVIAFAVVTTLPGVVVLGGVAFSLWLGWLSGPHDAGRTLPAVAVALAVILAVWLVRPPGASSSPPPPRHALARGPARALWAAMGGVREARCLLVGGHWRLAGSLGYYAFDNAVLWAGFQGFGRTPPLGVILMGYLVGSLGSLAPLPAGIGAAEGGLIGALALYGAPVVPAAGAVLLYRGISLLVPVSLSGCVWAVVPLARLSGRSRSAAARATSLGAGALLRRAIGDRLGRSHP